MTSTLTVPGTVTAGHAPRGGHRPFAAVLVLAAAPPEEARLCPNGCWPAGSARSADAARPAG